MALAAAFIKRSAGYNVDEAAVECVKQWRFKPAFRNGYAVKAAATLELSLRRWHAMELRNRAPSYFAA